MISDVQLQQLADLIEEELIKDFKKVHYSGNLMETITVSKTATGFSIEIPAEMYDLWTYQNEGVVVYTGEGSYAQEVNELGGFSGKHVNYVERAIMNALAYWNAMNQLHGKVTEI